MLVQSMLERALTAMLTENMRSRGDVLFEALGASGQIDEGHLQQIRSDWEALLEQRARESAGGKEALQAFVEELRSVLLASERGAKNS
jgi:hypothetical protein